RGGKTGQQGDRRRCGGDHDITAIRFHRFLSLSGAGYIWKSAVVGRASYWALCMHICKSCIQ
ncbi:MAG TPA: hypothetical protein PKZ99_01100, partial [Azospirillaceae bacterium]|nr:hypothetical protein [Azospirillaceae bacterium]